MKSSIKLKSILLIVFLLGIIGFSGTSFAGSCPDGSDPIKSISEDGTYFVFNCGAAKNSTSQSNDKNLSCAFKIERVFYGNSELGELEGWNLAEGAITIKDANVEFSNRSSWNMEGLSTDTKYLRDEVNIKLTEDGYFVGRMAYFGRLIKEGEVPVEPLYVTLTKHKRSKPINLKNLRNSAELWIDVEDWQGGAMFVSNCR